MVDEEGDETVGATASTITEDLEIADEEWLYLNRSPVGRLWAWTRQRYAEGQPHRRGGQRGADPVFVLGLLCVLGGVADWVKPLVAFSGAPLWPATLTFLQPSLKLGVGVWLLSRAHPGRIARLVVRTVTAVGLAAAVAVAYYLLRATIRGEPDYSGPEHITSITAAWLDQASKFVLAAAFALGAWHGPRTGHAGAETHNGG